MGVQLFILGLKWLKSAKIPDSSLKESGIGRLMGGKRTRILLLRVYIIYIPCVRSERR